MRVLRTRPKMRAILKFIARPTSLMPPPAALGMLAAIVALGAAFDRTAAIATNLTWEGMPLDLKDDEHGTTSEIIPATPTSELGDPLPRKHRTAAPPRS